MRSMLSVALLLCALWAMFSVDLGGRTFAEHMDTISETPEAQELVEGTRSRLNPALQELRDRVLGEYVEAPTWIPAEELEPTDGPTRVGVSLEEDEVVPASTLEPPLPGRRARGSSSDASTPAPSAELPPEPPLPGRRPATVLDEDPSLEPPLPGRRRL